MVEKDHAMAFVQITGTRILATLIASIMANRNCTYAEAQMNVESGLAKEAHHILSEIKNGERKGL